MINYLQVENLTKSYGDHILFADVTFSIGQGEKVGLIAQNGKGKTTMLRILAGEEDYDSGLITLKKDLKIGYLSQDPQFDPEKSILDNILAENIHEEDWTHADRARELLHKLQIEDFSQRPTTMSGGQLKRAAIARMLLIEPDMMILDEPTNHLDIATVEWLEQYLSTKKTTLLMVTHDRYFLDKVCNRIIEIDRLQTFCYEGNYDYYLAKRAERMENLNAELAKVKNLLRTELEWMRRQPQARGSKAKYRIDNFYELEKRSHIDLREKSMDPNAMKGSYIGSKIFEAKDVSKRFGDKVILKDWNYTFARYDKIGIVGENGVGKSTFIKLLLGEMQPDSGHFDIGQTVKWGYYSQEGMVDFDEKKKVIDAVREIAEEVYLDEKTRLSASQFLNHFLFSVADQQKYIYKLSGGERRRLNLAVVLMRNPNFLIFDEPTNDLDLVTLTILEDYIANFKGCVIVVSHDRFFLDRIAQHLFVFKGDGVIEDFPGNYSTYREVQRLREEQEKEQRREREEQEKRRQNGNAAPATTANSWRAPREKKGLSFKEKCEKEQLEIDLEKYESEKHDLEQRMSSGEMPTDALVAAGQRMAELVDAIDTAEMRLLELMEIAGE
jgi:ATP-binding cassette subfamily F protein uup